MSRMFKEGFSKACEAYGFYTYQDFYLFGRQIGIKQSRVSKIIKEFIPVHESVHILVERSFLNTAVKETYLACYLERIKRLTMNA